MNEEKITVEMLVQKVKDYASGRAKDVARGAETPALAALLLQKYGTGVIDTASLIFESPRAADPIFQVLDKETAKIDPRWREHTKQRWSGRPADVVSRIPEEKCEYCTGTPLVDRKPLMASQTSDYNVFINSCNYLEDSVIGGSVPHSLYGVKINFCPLCGRKLNKT